MGAQAQGEDVSDFDNLINWIQVETQHNTDLVNQMRDLQRFRNCIGKSIQVNLKTLEGPDGYSREVEFGIRYDFTNKKLFNEMIESMVMICNEHLVVSCKKLKEYRAKLKRIA